MLSALATTHLEAQMEQERKVIKDPHLAMQALIIYKAHIL
jgi:hypothetical protein